MKALPRQVIPIYLNIFIGVVGFTFLIPLFPELMRRYGTSAFTIGLLLSTMAVVAGISAPIWGRLSDRVGRKQVMIWSQGFSFAGYTLLAVAPNVPILFLSRVVEGCGGGNLGVAQSYIVDVVREDQRQQALAWSAVPFGLGFIVGPVLSGLLVKLGFSVPFWSAAALALLNLGLSARYLPDLRRAAATETPDARTAESGKLRSILTSPPMLVVIGRNFLYIFSFTYFFSVLALYVDRRFGLGPDAASMFLALAGGVGAVTLIFGADWADRTFGTARLAALAFGLALLSYSLLSAAGSVWFFAVVVVLWAAAGSLLRPTLTKLIADLAPEQQRGEVLGFAEGLNNLSLMFAPALATAVFDANPAWLGAIPAACVATGLALGAVHPRGQTHAP
jgi:DHA1 family tetracycline resistance protein-like MFS transporter